MRLSNAYLHCSRRQEKKTILFPLPHAQKSCIPWEAKPAPCWMPLKEHNGFGTAATVVWAQAGRALISVLFLGFFFFFPYHFVNKGVNMNLRVDFLNKRLDKSSHCPHFHSRKCRSLLLDLYRFTEI